MNKAKIKTRIFMVVLLVVCVTIIVSIAILMSPNVRVKRQLNLGNKYLTEENYEQAIIAFAKAIEIDPQSVDAYIGMYDVYVGLAISTESVEESADYFKTALEILEKGYAATGNDELLNKKTYIETQMASLSVDNMEP